MIQVEHTLYGYIYTPYLKNIEFQKLLQKLLPSMINNNGLNLYPTIIKMEFQKLLSTMINNKGKSLSSYRLINLKQL